MTRKLLPGEVGEVSYRKIPLKGARGKSVWQARVRVCLFDGTEKQPGRNADDQTEARNRVLAAAHGLLGAARGSEALKPESLVGLACRQWITELRVRQTWPNPPVRPQTVDEYERNLGLHVVPRLGKLRLRELTPAIVQSWIDGMIERAKDGPHDMVTTTIATRGNLIKVLDRAVVHDALRDNPARKTQAPARVRSEPTAMTVLDIGRLRAAVSSWENARVGQPGPRPTGHLSVVIDVMLGTGIRIGEAMALRWGEVNLSPDGLPTIAVQATLTDVKGEGTLRQEKTKTRAGERIIIIPPFLGEAPPCCPCPVLSWFAESCNLHLARLPDGQGKAPAALTLSVRVSVRQVRPRATALAMTTIAVPSSTSGTTIALSPARIWTTRAPAKYSAAPAPAATASCQTARPATSPSAAASSSTARTAMPRVTPTRSRLATWTGSRRSFPIPE